MTKLIVLAAALTSIISLPALAQEQKAEKPDCKLVTLARPDVTASPIAMTFRGDKAAAIAGCDQKGSDVVRVGESSTGGMIVTFKTTDGKGKIALPLSYTEGEVNQVVCKDRKDATKHAKYAARWNGQLPNDLVAEQLSSYDTAAADAGCGKLIERLAQKK